MISILTASTISTVTTIASVGSLSLVGIWTLLSLLVLKELMSTATSARAHALSRTLDVGIIPLLIAFAVIVAFKILEALR